MNLSEKIHEVMQEVGLSSQTQLAKRIGRRQESVSRYMHGSNPDEVTCLLLASLTKSEKLRLEWLAASTLNEKQQLMIALALSGEGTKTDSASTGLLTEEESSIFFKRLSNAVRKTDRLDLVWIERLVTILTSGDTHARNVAESGIKLAIESIEADGAPSRSASSEVAVGAGEIHRENSKEHRKPKKNAKGGGAQARKAGTGKD